ncbi:MAG: DUF7065 domain-containing protein [Myxococcota bacterium]
MIDFPFDEDIRFKPSDDELHPVGPWPDWTETTWWSFHVAERDLAGWLYAQIRPNLGTVTGGAFVYGPDAITPWESPYYGWFHYHPMPEPLELTNVTFKSGYSLRCLEPTQRYALGFRFRDQDEFVADLEFEGLVPPVPHVEGVPPFTGSSHYDQPGRLTGTLELRGETLEVDCVSVRDRSWGRRPELIGRRGRLSYAFGSCSPDDAFLAFCAPPEDDLLSDEESLSSGYLFRDGVLRRLERATRRVERDPVHGGVTRIEIEGADTDGRALHAIGVGRSRMFLPEHGFVLNTFMRWEIDGREGSGEDQDVWSTALFADRKLGRPR